jgi:NAD(P)-dependent dehydrogenase (short-subunit alcohol dehydrogenase family)
MVAGAARSPLPNGTADIALSMDLTSEESIAAAAESFGKHTDRLDLLINNAGLMHPSGRGENMVGRLNQEDMTQVLLTNLVGPALVVKHFLPFLKKGTNAKVVAVGAGVGSISGNAAGGWYSYRIAKTGLNQLTKNLSIELKRSKIAVACLYPRMVETDFSIPYRKGNPYGVLRTADEVAEQMIPIIEKLEIEPLGQFLDIWTGEQIPW